jgi:hypothetical protein
VIKDCHVEINLTQRKINIIKGSKAITVAANIPFAILRRIATEVELLGGVNANPTDKG